MGRAIRIRKTAQAMLLAMALSTSGLDAETHHIPISPPKVGLGEFERVFFEILEEELELTSIVEFEEQVLRDIQQSLQEELGDDFLSLIQGEFRDEFVQELREILGIIEEEILLLDITPTPEYAEILQYSSILSMTPGVSSSKFKIKNNEPGFSDEEFKSVRIPISRQIKKGTFCVVKADDQGSSGYKFENFTRIWSDDTLCMTPYVELSLSYLQREAKIASTSRELPISISVSNDIVSALTGIGLSIPITDSIIFRPILLGGYSYQELNDKVDNLHAENSGQVIQENLESSEYLHTAFYGGAAELRYQHLFSNEIDLLARLRYNYLVADTLHASNGAIEQSNDFVVVSGYLDATIPTGLTIFEKDVHVVGSVGSTILQSEFTKKNRT